MNKLMNLKKKKKKKLLENASYLLLVTSKAVCLFKCFNILAQIHLSLVGVSQI